MTGLIGVKWKGSKLSGCQAKNVTLTFDHMHDLEVDHWIFKVKFWNSHISGMEEPIYIRWKGCELIIHDHDLWVTMVGCVDVLDGDLVDFICRHDAFDSSCLPLVLALMLHSSYIRDMNVGDKNICLRLRGLLFHIEDVTICPSFFEWCLLNFLKWDLLYFESNYTEVCYKGPNWL